MYKFIQHLLGIKKTTKRAKRKHNKPRIGRRNPKLSVEMTQILLREYVSGGITKKQLAERTGKKTGESAHYHILSVLRSHVMNGDIFHTTFLK